MEGLSTELREALRNATLRGRCETQEKDGIEWFLDGAHTADSLEEVARLFKSKPRRDGERRALLFNQQERDVVPLLRSLAGQGQGDDVFDLALFTRNDVLSQTEGADISAQKLAAEAMRNTSPQTECSAWDNVTAAVEHIKELTAGGGTYRVLVTGSFHLVRAALQVLDPEGVE